MKPHFAALLSLSVGYFSSASAQAGQVQKYVARYQVLYTAGARGEFDNSAIKFVLDGSTVRGGLNVGDISISIARGSTFQSTLDNGTTLQLTRLPNGDLGVGMIGNIRSVNPPPPNQFLIFDVTINKPGVTTLRATNPVWSQAPANNQISSDPLGPAALTGGRFTLDPSYVAYNDSSVALEIRNLQLMSNISEAAFDALDVSAVYSEAFNPSLPEFTLSPGTNSADLGLMFNVSPEPDPGNYLAALGQVVDPSTGTVVGAFVQGVQVIPEPRSLILMLVGLAGVFVRWNGINSVLRRGEQVN